MRKDSAPQNKGILSLKGREGKARLLGRRFSNIDLEMVGISEARMRVSARVLGEVECVGSVYV